MKAIEIGAFEAKTHLSALLDKVRLGKVFFITKHGQPVAELRPATLPDRRLRFASDRKRVTLRSDFDAPLPDLKKYAQ
jgi:prevent-host-death family protein